MKYTTVLAAIAFSFAWPAALGAQEAALPATQAAQSAPDHSLQGNRWEAGVFADRLVVFQIPNFGKPYTASLQHYAGVGARAGINLRPNLDVEAQMSYDLVRNNNLQSFDSMYDLTFIRPLSALFGPKLELQKYGPFHVFATAKAGFIQFSIGQRGSGLNGRIPYSSTVTKSVAFYPGAGVEVFHGRVGLRMDVGDEIYMNLGPQNSLSINAGPVIRF